MFRISGMGKRINDTIGAHGVLTGRKLFCVQGSDGMTLDERGECLSNG